MTLTFDERGLKSTLYPREVKELFESAGKNLRNAEATFLYESELKQEREKARLKRSPPLDQKSARLASRKLILLSSPFTELYGKYEQTNYIRKKVGDIYYFLQEYEWREKDAIMILCIKINLIIISSL